MLKGGTAVFLENWQQLQIQAPRPMSGAVAQRQFA
jgi:hypothetical protein